jgi:hypothetical protein
MERILAELLEAARRAGVAVREVSLAGPELQARSGLCRLRGALTLFLDPGAPADERLRLLLEALRGLDLDDLYLSPAARSMLEGKGN